MRLTDRTSLTSAALNDLMHIVDISDKTDSDEGTSKKIRIDDMGFQLYSQRGKANGYTPLNSNVKIDTQYLPSYVDDVLEFTNRLAFPTTGEAGKIYIAKDTNFCYRWSGTGYVQVGGGGSGDVETVFGRMGNIVASQGDYKTSLITNNSNVSGAYLDDALDWLNANKAAYNHTHTFASITSKPTTLSGYGITNAYTKGQSDGKYLLNTTDTFTGVITFNNASSNGGIYTGSDSQRILIGGGSQWSANNGAYITIEGINYGGTGAGGDIHLLPTEGKSVKVSRNLDVNNVMTAKTVIADGGGGNPLRIRGTSSGNANIAYASFFEFNGTTRQGYLGFPSPSHSTMYMRNDVFGSDIRLDSDGVNSLKFNDSNSVNTVYHSGNHRSDSQNDVRYYTKGQSDNNYVKRNNRTDGGYAWIRYSGTGSPFYSTNQGTGDLARFLQGAGDGTTKAAVRNDGSYYMPTGGNIMMYNGGVIQRFSHTSGYLEGSYNTVGSNSANTNPIYIIGGSYTPTDTTLENMYGIGYAQGNTASFLNSTDLGRTPSTGWGMYLAAAGRAGIFLDASNGNADFRGGIYADRGVFRGTVTGSNLSGTNTGDQIAGTGLSGTSTLSVTNIAAGSSTSGALRYNGTTKSAGRLYGGSSNPSSSTRLNYDGHLYTAELTSVGIITANGFYESSDIRLKDNVESLNYGLKEIEKIDTHTWNWKSDGTEDMGVIAQELELIMPELVKTDEDGYKSVNYTKLIPVLINAIKELSNGKKS